MLYTYDYDIGYVPSMPVVNIVIGPALAPPTLILTAIVDSGADATTIPVQFLRQIQARRSNQVWIRGTAMQRVAASLYPISLRLGSFELRRIQVVGDTQYGETILGRDILNQLIVTLNGLANTVEISH